MAPPPTRKEQLALDELLNDIYRGIETLPDSAQELDSKLASKGYKVNHFNQQVKHYELPESSPLVQQHKQEIARLRSQQRVPADSSTDYNAPKAPGRSTLKRQQLQQQQQNLEQEQDSNQSLATFISKDLQNQSTSKRRVRIVEHPEKLAKQQQQHHQQHQYPIPGSPYARYDESDGNKYVNTNQLIYHEEPTSKWNEHDSVYTAVIDQDVLDQYSDEEDFNKRHNKQNTIPDNFNSENDNIDGTTRVEYYHTSWLDRQLGRASKRRSSKELNERQVKEKAMIEELKRSLKNGAITLKRSLKGKKSHNNTQQGQYIISADDQLNSYTDRPAHRANNSYNHNDQSSSIFATIPRKPKQDHKYKTSIEDLATSAQTIPVQQQLHQNSQTRHQLIQSHYSRPTNTTTGNYNTLGTSSPSKQQQNYSNKNNMRYPQSSTLCHKPALNNQHQTNTISRIPSATEVVRSALESSRSHQEDLRLRKTINSLDTPSPHTNRTNTPQTPTHQLRAASPSISPSPVSSPGICSPKPQQQQQVLRGTRIIPAPTTTTTSQDNMNKRQPIYANPHASLMQHRAEQQARAGYGSTGGRGNQASIREFNELDSLLKSLSPNPVSSLPARPNTTANMNQYGSSPAPSSVVGPRTQITPGYSAQPAQASLGGYGGVYPTNADVYAKVQRQQQQPNQPFAPGQQRPLQNSYLNNSNLTLDVTDDRSTLDRQTRPANEPQLDILPAMEDYQNISKLNPVRNHYWYKPNMTRERAIELLRDKPQGTFIVRDSNSFRGAYGLAVKVSKPPQNVLNITNSGDELIRHFLIEPTSSGVRLKGYANEPVFGSLPNLIYQHSLTQLALPCRLIIPRADIEDPQFNLKQKKFVEEFLASKEESKHLPYERTSPDGGYRRYPGNVLVHNEHRIIFQ